MSEAEFWMTPFPVLWALVDRHREAFKTHTTLGALSVLFGKQDQPGAGAGDAKSLLSFAQFHGVKDGSV